MAAEDRGACWDLPPQVVDKYFLASLFEQPFEYYTAKAICGQCAVRAACLTDAISSPAVFADSLHVIRGGESGHAIREMRRNHFMRGAPVAALVAEAIEHQDVNPHSIDRASSLRRGGFDDVELAIGVES